MGTRYGGWHIVGTQRMHGKWRTALPLSQMAFVVKLSYLSKWLVEILPVLPLSLQYSLKKPVIVLYCCEEGHHDHRNSYFFSRQDFLSRLSWNSLELIGLRLCLLPMRWDESCAPPPLPGYTETLIKENIHWGWLSSETESIIIMEESMAACRQTTTSHLHIGHSLQNKHLNLWVYAAISVQTTTFHWLAILWLDCTCSLLLRFDVPSLGRQRDKQVISGVNCQWKPSVVNFE